jgi:hypothetical protein
LFRNQRVWGRISFILYISTVLAACNLMSLPAASSGDSPPLGTQAPSIQSPTSTLPAEIPTSRPDAAQSQQEYTNQDFGFSLSYPQDYEAQEKFPHEIAFLAPQGTQGHRERAFLQVELTAGQTTDWFANQAKEENANLGTEITTSATSIDGQPAAILDRLPGQDLNRQVFIVYKGILYHLTFMPDDPQAGEGYQQMETLYTAMVNTLRFLPERREVPPVTDVNNMIYHLKSVLEKRSLEDVQRTLGDELFIGYWAPATPEAVTFKRYGRNEAAQLVIDQYLSQSPNLVFQGEVDWKSVMGRPEPFTAFFPDEDIRPVLVQGWGKQGSGEAAIIIARRSDGSLYWRGVFIPQGMFAQ